MQTWYPPAKVNRATRTAGSHASGYGWRLVVHTTESDRFNPSPTSYFGHESWPTLTLERDGQWWQHMPITSAARALRGHPTVETNRACAVQVECVGRSSADPDGILTSAQIIGLREFWAWLGRQVPVDQRAVPAGTIPGSASTRAPQRMTPGAWRSFSGVCGHRHVPGNEHWDPGALDLARLLTPATATPAPDPTPEDDDMKPYLAQAEGTPVYLIFPNGQAEAGVPTPAALADAQRIYGDTIEKVSRDFLRLHGISA